MAAAVAVALVVGLAYAVSQAIFRNAPGAAQTMPPSATETFGIRIETQDAEPTDDAPHLKIYEDPQCPGCDGTEEIFGPSVLQLVDKGMITVEVITAHGCDHRATTPRCIEVRENPTPSTKQQRARPHEPATTDQHRGLEQAMREHH